MHLKIHTNGGLNAALYRALCAAWGRPHATYMDFMDVRDLVHVDKWVDDHFLWYPKIPETALWLRLNAPAEAEIIEDEYGEIACYA